MERFQAKKLKVDEVMKGHARRFFVPSGSIQDGTVTITGLDVRHIATVLRLSPGDKVEVVDEESILYYVELVSIEKDRVVGRVTEKLGSALEEASVLLFQGLPKGTKMDDVVRGAVEVGADRIVPVITERSVPELDRLKAERRAARWRRIAAEASKQARRVHEVDVSSPVEFAEALQLLERYDAILVFWEEEEKSFPFEALRPGVREVAVFVGPEGGLTEGEVRALKEVGGIPVTLGKSLLRTETAGVVASAITRYELTRLSRQKSD
ncbi:MAG: 16S rRNA (uracil(1498)-N(3))-methyltransferase [Actinobacteria bacterium]|nr:16S rRNA (uracil(1498)-N(3))-methyltransferase [Actinomycetota bacterium]